MKVLAALAAVGVLAGFGGGTGAEPALYTVAGTSSCLAALPHSVSGVPPATKRYLNVVKRFHAGETGTLRLRNGTVTDRLTKATFCGAAASMACGA